MTNYVMFWDACTSEKSEEPVQRTEKQAVGPVEQELTQQIKELMKVYCIPCEPQTEFILLENLDTKRYKTDEEDQRSRILQQISGQVGSRTGWRLIIFQVEGTGDSARLADFLAYVMSHETSGGRPLNRFYLTCEKPENIWIITVRDLDRRVEPDLPQTGITDISCYSVYPPNCRFLVYPIDFRKKNNFDWQVLGLHAGVRCLAQNILPADLLRGNCVNRLEVKLDEAGFCDCIDQYEAWLERVDHTLRHMEQRYPPDPPGTEPPPFPERLPDNVTEVKRRLRFKEADPARRLKRLKEETDNFLDQGGQESRRLLLVNLERLQEWESSMRSGGLTEREEAQYRELMEQTELEMLEAAVIRESKFERLRRWCGSFANAILFFSGQKKSSGMDNTKTGWEAAEDEYLYANEMLGLIFKNKRTTLFHGAISMLYCILFTATTLSELGMDVKVVLLGSIALATLLLGVIFGGSQLAFWVRQKIAYITLQKQEMERIASSRKYFNIMLDHLRLNRILHNNEQHKSDMEQGLAVLKERRKELALYQAVCARLMICRIGMSGSEKKAVRRGNIWRMLESGSRQDLYGLDGQAVHLAVNGSPVRTSFSFVESIRIIRRTGCP